MALLSPTRTARPKYKEILEYGDLSDVVVLKSLVRAIVKPALGYMEKVIFNTCSAQVSRMKAAQAYDPIFAITNNITSGSTASSLCQSTRGPPTP